MWFGLHGTYIPFLNKKIFLFESIVRVRGFVEYYIFILCRFNVYIVSWLRNFVFFLFGTSFLKLIFYWRYFWRFRNIKRYYFLWRNEEINFLLFLYFLFGNFEKFDKLIFGNSFRRKVRENLIENNFSYLSVLKLFNSSAYHQIIELIDIQWSREILIKFLKHTYRVIF